MSSTKCNNPSCENSFFEISNESIVGAHIFIHFVRCTSCKTVIGLLDTNNIMDKLEIIDNKLDELLNQIQ